MMSRKSEALTKMTSELFITGFMAGWNRRHAMTDPEAEEFLRAPTDEMMHRELAKVMAEAEEEITVISERYAKILLR
jgi:hypothetical protein